MDYGGGTGILSLLAKELRIGTVVYNDIVRKEIIVKYISECEKNLSEKEINKLAKRTRGKIKEDILKCVEVYLKEEVYPLEPKHLTNTCDPYTGNWVEHLFNPYILKKILVNKGFTTKILNGYYGSYTNPIKKIIANFMNLAIQFLGKQGINLAPYYIIYAKK
ncbi:MAG: hypothetical protein P8Y62_07845 [candidate division WOR-3 bacterium]